MSNLVNAKLKHSISLLIATTLQPRWVTVSAAAQLPASNYMTVPPIGKYKDISIRSSVKLFCCRLDRAFGTFLKEPVFGERNASKRCVVFGTANKACSNEQCRSEFSRMIFSLFCDYCPTPLIMEKDKGGSMYYLVVYKWCPVWHYMKETVWKLSYPVNPSKHICQYNQVSTSNEHLLGAFNILLKFTFT